MGRRANAFGLGPFPTLTMTTPFYPIGSDDHLVRLKGLLRPTAELTRPKLAPLYITSHPEIL
jgi:hypothetical protein